MDYGFAAYSSDDASIVIASDTPNMFFIGKGTYIEGILGQYNPFLSYQYPVTTHVFRTPVITEDPVVFTTTPANAYVTLEKIIRDGTSWLISITSMGTGHATAPELYVFVGSAEFASVVPAAGYGMQLKDAADNITFDSRWAKKLLVCDDVKTYTLTDNFTTTYTTGISKPAVAFHSKYTDLVADSGGRYLWIYSMGINLASGTLFIDRIRTGYVAFVFGGVPQLVD